MLTSQLDSPSSSSYKAKDGLDYSSYEEMAEANKQFNNQILKNLGLLSPVPKAYSKKTSKIPRAKNSRPSKIAPPRRSNRIAKIPSRPAVVQGTSGELNEIHRGPLKTEIVIRKKERSLVSGQRSDPDTLNGTELEELNKSFREKGWPTVSSWLDDMEHWLLNVPHGPAQKPVSSANARTVLGQVRKLILKDGIKYHHWPPGIVFHWWKEVEEQDGCDHKVRSFPSPHQILGHDLEVVYRRAQDFEDMHGEDLGHGWLLRHPIRKLQLYQAYYFKKWKKEDV